MHNSRELCKQASVFPKLHYLEDHIPQFVRGWKVGPGMMGERGGETVHHLFYRLGERFANMQNPAVWYKHMLKQHLMASIPVFQLLRSLREGRRKV